MSYIYILQSLINSRYYIGSTIDLKRRISEHNGGKSKYTKLTKPFKLVFSQRYPSIEIARKIEYKIKSFKSRAIVEKIIIDREIKMELK